MKLLTRSRKASVRRPRALASGLGLVLLVLFGATAVVAGCGYGDGVGDGGTVSTLPDTSTTEPANTTTSVPSETTTTLAEETMTVSVYFSLGEKIQPVHRAIPKTQSVGQAAMKALLEGPTDNELAGNYVSNIPKSTEFLGLSIEDGIATVDLSKEYASGGGTLSMSTRLAQVVFTLTQFPSVEGVNFKLDGEPVDVFGGEGIILDHPVDRSDYEELSPAILIESPLFGDTVSSPLRIHGTANVFEAVFRVNIVDWDGLIIADEVVTATSGTGTRGTFDVTLDFPVERPGRGAVIAFVNSAKDGSPVDVVEIPVMLAR